MSSRLKEEVKLSALSLKVGETDRDTPCPDCGVSGDFTITRTDTGLLYHCYRAKCEFSGFIPSFGYELAAHSTEPHFAPKYFNRPLKPLPPRIRAWLKETYFLTDRQIRDNELKYDYIENRLWQPLVGPDGYSHGCTAKKLPREFATRDCDIEAYHAGVKSVAYWETASPHLDFPVDAPAHMRATRAHGICLVEDKLSAIRVNQFIRCAALCGSNLDDQQVALLAGLTDRIVLALDFDTWHGDEAKSYKFWKKYSLFFRDFQLRMIVNDPKEQTDEQILREIVRA